MSQTKSDKLFRVALSSITDAVITTDAQGMVNFLNPLAESLTGWTLETASGQPLDSIMRIIDERTRQPLENPALGVLRDGRAVEMFNHTALITRNGDALPIQNKVTPIEDESGKLTGLVLVLRDLRERRRTEQLEAEHERLMALRADASMALATAPTLPVALQKCVEALVHHLDLAFARVWLLDANESVLELTASAGMYTHLDGPHSRIRLGEFKIGRIALNRQSHLTNNVAHDPNISDPGWAKREGMVAFAGYPLLVGDRVLGVLGMFARRALSETVLTDLAPLADSIAQYVDRKQLERAQAEQTQLLEAVMNNATTALFMMDAHSRCTYMNPAAEQMTGYSLDEVRNKVLHDYIHHTRPDGTPYPMPECPIDRALPEQFTVSDHEDLFIRKDGTFFPVVCNAIPIVREGKPAGTVIEVRDVTEERRNEALVAGQKEVLELLVRGAPLEDVLEVLCGIAERQGGERLVSTILLLEPNQTRLRLVAGRSCPDLWRQRLTSLPLGPQAASCGTAAFRRELVLVSDIASDPLWEDYREAVLNCGLRSCWCTPIFSSQGNVLGTFAIYCPIARAPAAHELRLLEILGRMAGIAIERRTYEEALQRSEEIHRVLAELTADYGVIGQIQPDGTLQVESVTAGFQKVTGYTLAELDAAGGWPILVHPEDMPTVEQSIQRWLRGEAHTSQIRIRTRAGELRWLEYYGRVVQDAGEQLWRLYIAAQDITDRKRAQADLQEQREWLQVTLSSIGDGVIATDVKGRVTFLNGVAVELTGWTPDEARGQLLEDVFQIVNEDTRLPVENPAVKALRSGTIVGLANHTILISKDGSERPIDDSAAPIRDTSGNVIGVVLVFRDASEKRHTEQALRIRAEELAMADRRKNEFLAMLAHELRNPLAPIRSGLSLLALDQGDSEPIQLMQEQVDHLVRLVDDLLDVSRIVRGRIELRREPVDLATVVARAVQTVRPFVEERRHELIVTLPPDPIYLDADPVRLAQVFTNLLNNSAKYTDPCGKIWLTAERRDGGVLVHVRDNGMGIEPDLLPHVFDLFTQSERSIDRSQGGLGLGLTLVRSLVEMHDGTVTAYSEGPGHGSEFVIHLPVVQATEQASRDYQAQALVPKRRVLVVDDNVGAAKMLRLLLTRCGAQEVYLAYDGPAALESARAYRPEVILLDIGLPRMDGYEVAKQLRSEPDFDSALLVAVTGYGQEEDIQRSREAGFDEHLVKPPAIESLLQLFVHPKLNRE